MSIYNFEAKTIQGETIKLSDYQNKVIVIVNTASKCGLTPQYKGLEELNKNYKDKDLVVLGFPCNQFGSQEPGTAENISQFCEINYGVSFQIFDKVEVNGKNEHPLFSYLKKELPSLLGKNIKWNFTKFVIDKSGQPIKRFAPTTPPKKMEKLINKLIQ
jgi:glutathione peroxidase